MCPTDGRPVRSVIAQGLRYIGCRPLVSLRWPCRLEFCANQKLQVVQASPVCDSGGAKDPEPPALVPLNGTILGAAGLITGSTVGAGILALPQTTYDAGFAPSAVLLITSWVILQLEALLLVEVNIRCHHHITVTAPGTPPRVVPLTEMAGIALGPSAEASTTAVYLAMTFTLLLAYTARAGDVIETASAAASAPLPHGAGHATFNGALAAMLIAGGTPAAVAANKGLTAAMLALFTMIVGGGAVAIGGGWADALLSHANWSPTSLAQTLPIMFLALVYHDLIPVVCALLGFDRSRIVAALAVGSVPPLAMFLAWEAVCLGLVPWDASHSAGLDPVDALITMQGPIGGTAIAAFSLTALATSAIGTSLSLTAFLRTRLSEVLQPPLDAAEGAPAPAVEGTRLDVDAYVVALTLIPPTLAAVTCADLFRFATHLAGAYGDLLLFGILPPVLAYSLRRREDTDSGRGGAAGSSASAPRLLAGGPAALAALSIAGAIVELVQLDADLPGWSLHGAGSPMQPVYEVASASGSALMTSVSATVDIWAATMQPAAVHVAGSL